MHTKISGWYENFSWKKSRCTDVKRICNIRGAFNEKCKPQIKVYMSMKYTDALKQLHIFSIVVLLTAELPTFNI